MCKQLKKTLQAIQNNVIDVLVLDADLFKG